MALQKRIAVVAYSDGRVERYPISPPVEIQFERTYKVGMGNAFTGDGGTTRLYQLAWEAMRVCPGSGDPQPFPLLEKWVETVDALDVETEDVDVRPFEKAPPTSE